MTDSEITVIDLEQIPSPPPVEIIEKSIALENGESLLKQPNQTILTPTPTNGIIADDTNLLPFRCDICSKSFAQRRYLAKHMLRHTGERPHICDQCGRAFSQKANLDVHLARHRGEKKYICHRCPKGFVTKQELADHMLTHTGHRPYRCHHCELTFARRTNLSEHLLKHKEEEELFRCVPCGRSFISHQVLAVHSLRHNIVPADWEVAFSPAQMTPATTTQLPPVKAAKRKLDED